MLRRYSLFIFTALVFVFPVSAWARSCTATEKAHANAQLQAIAADPIRQETLLNRHAPLGLPTSPHPTDHEQVLYQGGYLLDHDGDLRTTLWVTYRLTKADVDAAAGKARVTCFRRDPRLPHDEAATPADYSEPIYDQGHMANDADMKDNLTEQLNTYVMSNMSPQHCRFNRGIWLSLESLTRRWAKEYHTVYVTSGALFDRNGDAQRDPDDQAQRMTSNSGKTRVAVPSHYYKIILRKTHNTWKGIAFLLPNTDDAHGVRWDAVRPDVSYHIVPIGVIEHIAGVRFFPKLHRDQYSQQVADWDLSADDNNLENTCH